MANRSKNSQMKKQNAQPNEIEAGAECSAPQTAKDIPITYKSKTFSLRDIHRAMRHEKPLPPEVYEWLEYLRPKTRADCQKMERPCPYVSCKHHLYLDMKPNGSYKINFWGVELSELRYTCALDVADRRQVTPLEEIGSYMNLTRERVRQIEEEALRKLGPGLAELLRDD